MLNIIFATANDVGYETALRLESAGNLVKFYNTNDFKPRNLGGLKRIYSHDDSLQSADLVIAAIPGFTNRVVADANAAGIPVFGGGPKAALIYHESRIHDLINKMFYKPRSGGIPVVFGLYRQDNKWAEFSSIGFWQYRLMDGERGPISLLGPTTGWAVVGSNHAITGVIKDAFNSTFDGINCFVTLPVTLYPDGEFSLSYPFSSSSFLNCNLFNVMVYSEVGRKGDLTKFFYDLAVGREPQWNDDKVVYGVNLWNVGPEDITIDNGAAKHLWFFGPDARSIVATSEGSTLREAGRRVMRTLKRAIISPNVAFRTDGLSDAIAILDTLVEWGYFDAAYAGKIRQNIYQEFRGDGTQVSADRKDRNVISQESGKGQETSLGNST